MNERRREAAHLGRRLARHRQRQARTAVALLELERRPGHRLLDGGTHGRTRVRLDAARATRDRMWHDVERYAEVLDAAGRVRPRTGTDRLRVLLVEADGIVADVRRALHELHALASACESARSSALDALVPVARRLAGARRAVDELGLASDDPDAVAARELTAHAADVERGVTGDPLADTGRAAVAGLAGPAGALCARLDELARLRAGWGAVTARLDRDLTAVVERRARVVRVRARAGAQLRDLLPARPPDRGPELRDLRDAVATATGWRGRHDAVVALAGGLAAAHAEQDAVAVLVAGLIERRDDLRGRFGAYRARTRRLGRADDPELAELAGRITTRLWDGPAELARATRDLAAYRRRLAALGAR